MVGHAWFDADGLGAALGAKHVIQAKIARAEILSLVSELLSLIAKLRDSRKRKGVVFRSEPQA